MMMMGHPMPMMLGGHGHLMMGQSMPMMLGGHGSGALLTSYL